MSYLTDIFKEFQALPQEIKQLVGDEKAIAFVNELEKKYKVELEFPIMLVATKELSLDNLEEYLVKKYKISKNIAFEVKKELINNIFQPLLLYLKSDIDMGNDTIPVSEEKKIFFEAFSKNLIDLMKDQFLDIKALNVRLIYLVFEEKNFQEGLLKILYSNSEKLTSQEFILDGKRAEPVVSNWLRDFIKSEGSDMFDELALSKYLINSANAKKLDEEEKKLLRKLLILYRNLKFFPESLADLPSEEWEIIPVEKAVEELSKARTVSEPLKIVKEEKIIAKASALPPLPKEYEKEDLAKAAPAGVSSIKEEELPNIGSLISQARKEAEEKLAETSSAPTPIKSMTLTLEEVANQAERAISELKISLNPEEKNRLKNILVSFLKGIRDSIETKDALLKPKEEGGLNFTPQQVEQIFNLIKKQKPLKEESLVKEKTFGVSFDEQMKDVLRTQEQVSLKPTEEEIKKEEKPSLQPIELMPPPPSLVEASYGGQSPPTDREGEPPTAKILSSQVLETFREKLKEKIISQPALSQLSPSSQESQLSQPSRLTPPPPSLVEVSYGGQSPPTDREGEHLLRRSLGVRRAEIPEIKEIKPRLEDIKRSSFSGRRPRVELVGPIEEIRNLTLADLREMSDSPDKAFEKIKGKISLLEKESFLKKIQAIKAWREGEIYRLYVEIGREVIQKKFIIAKILKERSAKGLPILTEEEFSAIMDFNKTLRF